MRAKEDTKVSQPGRESPRRLRCIFLAILVFFIGNALSGREPGIAAPLLDGNQQASQTLAQSPERFPKGAHESGIVVEIRLDGANPLVVTRARSATQVYRISPRTSYWRVDLNSHKGETIDPRSIFPGDLVDISVEFSVDGKIADGVTVYVREERGIVRELWPTAIALEDGRSFQLLPTVRVLISGRLGEREAVQPGSSVIVRINPVTREVTEILVL